MTFAGATAANGDTLRRLRLRKQNSSVT